MELQSISSPAFQKSEPLLKSQNKQDQTSQAEVSVPTKPTKETLEKVIDAMNDMLIPAHTSTKFVLHEKLNDYYVQILDEVTKDVVKEIPNKKFLDMYAEMIDFMGIFVDKKI
ncbi:flagellar protein FlaG [Fictibacillus phosphorivorans]|uniref:flagellar protein FlaG n=1 Tax=Fictibacillus phosphorivorans TaxID=1221500 RepID=UPI00203DEDBC|nr:flagellar protein FlaG [Fictibacillus phosphorivorans]MCM3776185.1 flagellar protein FlaG [Fictibacillus phosphorivorans]